MKDGKLKSFSFDLGKCTKVIEWVSEVREIEWGNEVKKGRENCNWKKGREISDGIGRKWMNEWVREKKTIKVFVRKVKQFRCDWLIKKLYIVYLGVCWIVFQGFNEIREGLMRNNFQKKKIEREKAFEIDFNAMTLLA